MDTNRILMIDPATRKIEVPEKERIIGVYQDHDSERKYFKCQRIVGDNVDLSQHRIYINYVPSKINGTFNEEEEVGSYCCEDVATDGDYVTFSWRISDNATREAGYIAFAVYAKKADADGNLKTKWHTTPAIGNVLDTLPDGDQIVSRYPDIIEQIMERLDRIGEIDPEQIQKNTDDISKLSKKISECVIAPTTAAVGQTVVVKDVDENGKPTEWEPVDFPEQVQSDWNQNDETQIDYIKNRPFYDTVTQEDIIAEQTKSFTYSSSNNWYMTSVYDKKTLTDGVNCKILWDGTVYDVVSKTESYSCFGDKNFIEYPFYFILSVSEANREIYGYNIYTNDTSSSHTFRIYTEKTDVKCIDEKYLPFTSETFTFTLEDGTEIVKEVYVKP